jgi:hypothetical protein
MVTLTPTYANVFHSKFSQQALVKGRREEDELSYSCKKAKFLTKWHTDKSNPSIMYFDLRA